MARVTALGYVGWEVKKLAEWDDLLQSIYGLELRADSPRNTRHYRLDDYHHRISLYGAENDGVRFIGWEVDTREGLEELGQRLSDNGVKVKRGTREQIEERAVMDLICFDDPDGFKTEIYFNGIRDYTPFCPVRSRSGFTTGALGLGHVVVHCKDRAATTEFYQDMLGFRISDYIHWPDNTGKTAKATFLHCNPRHHSLALVNESFGLQGGEFNHLMLEAKSLDDVGRAYDVVNERGFPIALTMGRHTNDRITSFYLFTPSGWAMEYGYNGHLVDDETWETKYYNSTSSWGHKPGAPPGHWPEIVTS